MSIMGLRDASASKNAIFYHEEICAFIAPSTPTNAAVVSHSGDEERMGNGSQSAGGRRLDRSSSLFYFANSLNRLFADFSPKSESKQAAT